MNREGLDVVTIRAIPREGREVPQISDVADWD